MAVRITCISKDGGYHLDFHEGITEFGWTNEETRAMGKTDRAGMVDFIQKQGGKAYVKDRLGNVVNVGVVNPVQRTPYLRTYADGKWSDNLLALPEC